ncbi:MAG: damage-inducible protein DinB [Planctomycetes bacterium]|nr:damage-inducible protein DinB [Planctomycetota bacterium]
MASRYTFLVDTFASEIEKVLSVWAMAGDGDLDVRPRVGDRRGRTLREHMVHQCQSEAGWFTKMFDLTAPGPVLPADESRLGFLRHYAAGARQRHALLAERDDTWWEATVPFFAVPRPRTWIMVRRIAHTAHHRGQQTALLRALGRDLHSTYGPTADTGGLPKDAPAVVYPYADVDALLAGEAAGGQKQPLPPAPAHPVTERAPAAPAPGPRPT